MPANFNPLNGRVNYIPPDTNTGNVQNWHVTVQRELLNNLLVDVAYIGNRSRNLVILGDYNQARPNNAGEDVPLQARRPIQGYQFIQAAFDGGKAELPRAAGEGGAALHARAVFPQLVHVVEGRGQRVGPPRDRQRRQQPRQLPRHRRRVGHLGLQPADQQHDDGRLGAAVRPRSPLGEQPEPDPRRHRRRLAPDGDQHDDERPAREPELLALVDVLGQRRADLPAEPSSATSTAMARSTTTSTGTTSSFRPTATQPFGDAPRNVARGPAIYSLDLGLHKGFGLGLGDSRLEFRIEAFNALNKTNFGAPNGNRSSTDFGTIRTLSTHAAADSAGREGGFLGVLASGGVDHDVRHEGTKRAETHEGPVAPREARAASDEGRAHAKHHLNSCCFACARPSSDATRRPFRPATRPVCWSTHCDSLRASSLRSAPSCRPP